MENIIFLALGCIMLYFTYAIGIKNKITLFHDYHTLNIKEKDVLSFTRISGLAFLVISISSYITLFFNIYVGDINVLLYIGGILLGIGILIFAVIRYNESLFS